MSCHRDVIGTTPMVHLRRHPCTPRLVRNTPPSGKLNVRTADRVVLLDDADGSVAERYDYSPYGQRIVLEADYSLDPDGQSDLGNPLGHQGLMHDAESGLIYNRARYLNPHTGRFMQRDPIGYPDGMNTYAAYHVMRGGVDPSGRRWDDDVHEVIRPDGTVRQGQRRRSPTLSGTPQVPYDSIGAGLAMVRGATTVREVVVPVHAPPVFQDPRCDRIVP